MIALEHVSKTYAAGGVTALQDVSFTIEDGEIFGIIGLSGAGKSTLVRCLNRLEAPSSGRVTVDGQDLRQLSGAQLRALRRRMPTLRNSSASSRFWKNTPSAPARAQWYRPMLRRLTHFLKKLSASKA